MQHLRCGRFIAMFDCVHAPTVFFHMVYRFLLHFLGLPDPPFSYLITDCEENRVKKYEAEALEDENAYLHLAFLSLWIPKVRAHHAQRPASILSPKNQDVCRRCPLVAHFIRQLMSRDVTVDEDGAYNRPRHEHHGIEILLPGPALILRIAH